MLSKGIKKFLLIPVFTICGTVWIFASSDQIMVSIITIDPGKEIYTLFGHTAIRIHDERSGADKVYNFGTFNFNDSGFYLKFIKGSLKYSLSVTDFVNFAWNLEKENRTMHEQIIKLSPEEKILLQNNLKSCYLTDCRYYTYDFFHNNCATKVRDYLYAIRSTSLEYDSVKYCSETFRSLIKPYIKQNYWLELGINLALGKKADQIANAYQYMFLPFYIYTILNDSGIVIADRKLHVGYTGKHRTGSWWFAVLVVAVLVFLRFIKTTGEIPLILLSSVTGITGLILLMISLVSQIPALKGNMNIYWTMPALLVLITWKSKPGKIIKATYLVILIVMLLAWNFLPQTLSVTFIPWIIAMVILLIADLLPAVFTQ